MGSSAYDNQGQYSKHSILRYEKIFGDGFVSSGGAKITHSFCERLKLPENPKVLDIGSGLGGAAFYLAERFGATVMGVDLSENMVEVASERAKKNGSDKVTFHLGDVRKMDLEPGSFDLVWSRDSLLHIPEKKELFVQMTGWLKVGGQVMLSDYARGAGDLGDDFRNYMETSGYDLWDVESYGNLLKEAGLGEVMVEDWSQLFVETLREEQAQLRENRSRFLADFTEEDLDYLLARWERKVQFCLNGDMHVGLWQARRLR